METKEFFGKEGLLSKHLAGYHPRPGQIALAEAVENAIADKQHLLAEGPTGTGKSISYLVPAGLHILDHGEPVVIATANITLQEQLINKDLPFITSVLPPKSNGNPISYALFKGMGNYGCKRKMRRLAKKEETLPELRKIITQLEASKGGDKSELDFAPDEDHWQEVCASRDDCLRKRCAYQEECYLRSRFKDADIIVCNYHLLYTDILVRNSTDGCFGLLPAYGPLILDEAHEAASIAQDFCGWNLSAHKMEWILRRADDINQGPLAAAIRTDFHDLLSFLQDRLKNNKSIIESGVKCLEQLIGNLSDLSKAFREAVKHVKQENEDAAEEAHKKAVFASTCTRYTEYLQEIGPKFPKQGCVYYVEENRKSIEIKCKVVDSAPFLRENLFNEHTTVAVSATMTTEGNFNFIAEQFGLDDGDYSALVAPSPFDPGNVLVCVPRDFVEPNSPNKAHPLAVSKVVERMTRTLGGRTMALFTSNASLATAAVELRNRLRPEGYSILVQGEMQKMHIINTFKAAAGEKMLILATASFWQGVDIPGRTLSCVVIDKVPFPSPQDPVVYYIEHKTRDAFIGYSVPTAVIALKQGIGRLIRTETDYGTVIIADSRINTKRYGAMIRSAFPALCWSSDDVEDAVTFVTKKDAEVLHE